jgi:hypothetical protein
MTVFDCFQVFDESLNLWTTDVPQSKKLFGFYGVKALQVKKDLLEFVLRFV